MLNLATLQTALQAWAASGTGLPCIWVNQHAPQPALNYCTLKMGPFRGVPGMGANTYVYDNTQPQGSEVQETFTKDKEFTLTLECFTEALQTTVAAPAISYLEQALITLGLFSTISSLFAAGISLVDADPATDLTALVATDFQSRASVDIRFTVCDTVSVGHGYIEEAEITPTISDPAGNVLDNTTIDVDVT